MVSKTTSDLPSNMMAFLCDPISEQMVCNVIKDMSLPFSAAAQGDIKNVLDFLQNARSPKILIMDISNSDLPLTDIAKVKERLTPNVEFIIVGTKNEVGLYRDLMLAGASDYLVKPLNSTILKDAINKASGVSKEYKAKTGKIVQFISAVGGAGATTTAINTAWLLANTHFKRTVVMDVDFLYGTANLMLDIKSENAYLEILESPDKIDEYFIETILKKHDIRLYYLGGLVDLQRGPHVDIAAFEALLNMVKTQFNYVIIDSTRELSPINKVCKSNADTIVVLIEMSIASAQNASRLLESLATEHIGKKIIVVANKVGLSSGGSLSKTAFEKVIDRKINYLLPLDESIALAAANIGQPLASSNSPMVEVLEQITNDVLGNKEEEKIAEALIAKEGWTPQRIKNSAVDLINKMVHSIKQ